MVQSALVAAPRVESPAVATRASPPLVSGWSIDALLASSDSTRVYAATHARGQRGAIKVLSRTCGTDRHLHEIALTDAASTVGSPSLLGYGVTDDGSPYLIVELLSGQTLADQSAARGGRFDLATALLLSERLFAIAAQLHRIGVVHRDLHPRNIFITSHADVRVLDYSDSASGDDVLNDCGRPSLFAPPEQHAGVGDANDPRADVFAIGAVLYWMLTGCTGRLSRWSCGFAPELPLDDLAHMPWDVIEFLELALERDPQRRVGANVMRTALLSMHAAFGGLSRGDSEM